MPLQRELIELSTASPIIATYSFDDIAEGTGNVQFYLGISKDSGGTDYLLTADTSIKSSTNSYNSDPPAPSISFPDSTSNTYTFDLSQFNFSKKLKGKVFFSMNYSVGNSLSSEVNTTFAPTFELFHYDGSTETSLGTVTTETQTLGVLNTRTYWGTFLCEIDVTETYFKQGDNIRLKINYTAGNPSGNGSREIYCDPNNRSPAYGNGDSFISVPFKIEI